MHFTRRSLLQGAVAGGALGALPLGCATPSPARHLILIGAFGGWDTTFSFDPKPSVPGFDLGPGDVEWFGNIPIWTHDDRPVARRFFEQFAPRCAVINGISVRSISHHACMARMLTGTSAARAPDLAAIVGSELGADRPIPYLILGEHAYPGSLEAFSGRAGLSNQLARLALPQTPLPPTPDDDAAVRRFIDARLAGQAQRWGDTRNRIDDFLASRDRSDQLIRARSGSGGSDLVDRHGRSDRSGGAGAADRPELQGSRCPPG